MPESTHYQAMPLSQLVTGCRQETAKFQEQQLSDENYCFEILRRTFQERDSASEEVFAMLYTLPLRIWLRQYQARYSQVRLDEDDLLSGVFLRLFRFIPPENFSNFTCLTKILYYFKSCCLSEVLDQLRRCTPRQNELPLTEDGPATADLEELSNWLADRGKFWKQIDRHPPREIDRGPFTPGSSCKMPPREK